MKTKNMGWLLGVHVGAGNHASAKARRYELLMQQALLTGRARLVDDGERTTTVAADVVAAMVGVFEQSDLTNCGTGSNLTEHGAVECEASVVCGATRRVACCANVQGVAQPAPLALALLEAAQATDRQPHAMGREPPLVVMGAHARRLATASGLACAEEKEALDDYQVFFFSLFF